MKKTTKFAFLFPIVMILQGCSGGTNDLQLPLVKQTYEITTNNSGRFIEYGETKFNVDFAEFNGKVSMRLKEPSKYEVISPIVINVRLDFKYKTLFSGTKEINHSVRITIEANTSEASADYTKTIPGLTIVPLEATVSYNFISATGKVRER